MSTTGRLVARFLVRAQGGGVKAVHVRMDANGRLTADSDAREDISRVELYSSHTPASPGDSGALLFWTHCAKESKFSIDDGGKVLSINFNLRNAAFFGAKCNSGDRIGCLRFEMKASYMPQVGFEVRSVDVGRALPGGEFDKFVDKNDKKYNPWVERELPSIKKTDFDWKSPDESGKGQECQVPILSYLAGRSLFTDPGGYKPVPIAIRRARHPERSQDRIEILIGLQENTEFDTKFAVPALRLPGDRLNDARIDYGIQLGHDQSSQQPTFRLVQTDPWDLPAESEREVWREFRIEGLPVNRLLEGFNRAVTTAIRESLTNVDEANGVSALPLLEAKDTSLQQVGVVRWQQRDLNPDAEKPGDLINYKYKIDDFGPARDIQIETIDAVKVVVSAPSLILGEKGAAFEAMCLFKPLDARQRDARLGVAINANLVLNSSSAVSDKTRIDLGAMRITMAKAPAIELTVPWRLLADSRRKERQRVLYRVHAKLSGVQAAPNGFDLDPTYRFSDNRAGDVVSAPLLLLADGAGGIDSDLEIDEIARLDRSRGLSAELKTVSPRGATGQQAQQRRLDMIVLDDSPLFVGKFSFEAPHIPNDGSDRTYARWSLSDPEGPRWRYKARQPSVTLTLPPQGVGEAYERGKEIPETGSGGKHSPIEFRFAPHAEFDLRLRDEERAYSELPWNLRLLFGRPGEAAAGPLLTSARFELLYGLEATLQPVSVRLTTDETGRGHIPEPFADPQSNYNKRWNALSNAYRARVLPLLPYRPLVAERPRFDERSGLSQRLRLAPMPESENSNPAAVVKIPSSFADLHAHPYRARKPGEPGLRGGATFGFESERIYRAVVRQLQSTSGEVSQLAWTALGGYGALKARFDEDRSTIEARVEQGRVSHYAVERIGRIGVFWNRAKHVIVYERSTVRADRYDENSDETQSPHVHLALVRKVDEYIELLEPERRFAPVGQAERATGFVQGLKFSDRIIRVSSLWGRDVGEVGWVVPLWRRDATKNPEQSATLFPKPLIQLIAASENANEEALHAIADPEGLLFYTTTEAGAGSDSDRWAAVEGVDFVVEDVRVADADDAFGDRSADTLRKPLSAPVDTPVALAPCTWRIESGTQPIDLIAGRGAQPVSAQLRNITVMRKPATALVAGPPTQKAKALLTAIDALRHDVRRTLARGLAEGWGKERWTQEGKRFQSEIFALGQQIDADIEALLSTSPCYVLIEQAMRPVSALIGDFKHRVQVEGERVKQAVLAAGKDAQGQLQRYADEFVGRLDVLAAQGDQAKVQVDEALLRVRDTIARLDAQVVATVERSKRQLDALLVGVENAFDLSIQRLRIARAQQALAEARQGLIPVFDELQQACDKLAVRWKGSSAGNLAQELSAKIAAAQNLVVEGLDHAEEKLGLIAGLTQAVRADFKTAIDTLSERLDEARAVVIRVSGEIAAELDEGVTVFESLASRVFVRFSSTIEELRQALKNIRGELSGLADPNRFAQAVDAVMRALEERADGLHSTTRTEIAIFIDESICRRLPSIDKERVAALLARLEDLRYIATEMANGAVDKAQTLLGIAWPHLSRTLDEVSEWAGHLADSLGQAVRTALDAPLSLLRAFGGAPALPGLSFNREWLEYVFDPSDLTIDISPVTSFFAELGDDLKGLSLNLPSIGLDTSGLLPPALRDFDLNAVFGSIGGMKMPGLLSRVKLPKLDRDAVKLTHGFDKKARRAWAQADVDVPYGSNPALFEAMGLTLRLVKPRFTAQSRLEAGLEGKPGFHAWGEVASTMRLEFSGNALVDLRDARIRFDDRGDFDFDFSPDRIDFKAGLKFLADLIRARQQANQDPDQARGFVPALIEADGVPVGVRTTLELDPGPLNFGTFALDGLALNLSFELVAKPEFRVATRLGLASPEKPFVLSVGLLGGGGWLVASASYLPAQGLIESEVDIAIAAGRTFGVNFGPIRGMAQVVFGVNAKFVSRGSRSRLSLIVFFLFRGNFRLWGIVTVGIDLRLEIEYQSTGSLVGRGVVHITVKIGCFFKRTVRQRVNYRFAGKPGGNAQLAAERTAVAAAASPPPLAALADGIPSTPKALCDARAKAYLARYED